MATNQGSPTHDARRTAETDDAGGEVAVKAPAPGNGKGGKPARAPAASPAPSKAPSTRKNDGDVGQLLRGAYRQTVDEAIPDDLMDLLNRLE